MKLDLVSYREHPCFAARDLEIVQSIRPCPCRGSWDLVRIYRYGDRSPQFAIGRGGTMDARSFRDLKAALDALPAFGEALGVTVGVRVPA